MRYLTIVKSRELPMDQVPPAMFEVIDQYAAALEKKGTLVSRGGLMPSSEGFQVVSKDGKLVFIDGPFSESKEVIGGWAFMNYATREEAVAGAKEFMELHRKHWPAWEGICEVRRAWEE